MKREKVEKLRKKKTTILTLTITGLLFVITGIAYSIFYADLKGIRENTINSNTLIFEYEEPTNELMLEGNQGIKDEDGIKQEKYFEFTVTGKSNGEQDVPYYVYIEKLGVENEIPEEKIKYYLTKVEEQETPVAGVELLSEVAGTTRKVIYTTTMELNNNEVEHRYRLRLWLDETYDIKDLAKEGENSNGEQTAILKEHKYKYRVNISTKEELDKSGANVPELATGMIPVYYDSTENVWKKADETNSNETYKWYDYDNKMWANAVTVTSTNRATYLNDTLSPAGTPIAMNDINTMWVWIPRYKAFGDTANYNGGTIDAPGAFTINFVDKNDDAHEAFTFGSQDLSGIWVGKFENSSNITCTVSNNAAVGVGCNLTTIRPKIIPNGEIWRGAMVSTFFNDILNMKENGNQYGFDRSIDTTLDTHLIKNSEWGAIAYLSQSIYGRCSNATTCPEIGANNNMSVITGYGAPAGSDKTATNGTYETELGKLASTTGNIYGVYDMSGGSYDIVMGVYWDGTNKWSGYGMDTIHSGFNGCLGSGCYSTYQSGEPYPDEKYYDLYTTESNYTNSNLQHALVETSKWYGGEGEVFVNGTYSWFMRGSAFHNSELAGIFNYYYGSGSAYDNRGSRSVLIK